MKTLRVPSVPLITHDPYFSLWSPYDHLYDGTTCHWTGREQTLTGTATIDGVTYRFMGAGETSPTMTQSSLQITPTSSAYTFEAGGLALTLRFTSPLLLNDLERLSMPCTFLDFSVNAIDGAVHTVTVTFTFDEAFCHSTSEHERMTGGVHAMSNGCAAWMGRRQQPLLAHSGDNVTIDWGYLYLARPNGNGGTVRYEETPLRTRLCGEWQFDMVGEPQTAFFVVGYDDVAAIEYFGVPTKAYWAREGKTILEALSESMTRHRALLSRCEVFGEQLVRDAERIGGKDYARLCTLAYRQSIAAHKLIADSSGEAVFLSKECFSNGCIGTVDVSYPSVPLYLLYNPELVKGMMRPVLAFAHMPVWGFDFAPHDVGRYPYATGQVYGAMHHGCGEGDVFPPYYLYPDGTNVYDLHCQMPVEECGNMLIMAAAVTMADGSADFAAPYDDLWEKWVSYLLTFGADPGEQLCTDDFAGHLAHNVNLSAKAIMGVEAYSVILRYGGRAEEAAAYHERARDMAADWARRADRGDHTALTFDNESGWSLKYNLIWDRLFGSDLFSPELYQKEVSWYIAHQNTYGVPLDSRRDYTKSDWILWCAAMSDEREKRQTLIAPIARFLEETADRVPFSDWYETVTGEHHSFQNRTVQGGLFMPLLAERLRNGR